MMLFMCACLPVCVCARAQMRGNAGGASFLFFLEIFLNFFFKKKWLPCQKQNFRSGLSNAPGSEPFGALLAEASM
jgi:hypothetical protein